MRQQVGFTFFEIKFVPSEPETQSCLYKQSLFRKAWTIDQYVPLGAI